MGRRTLFRLQRLLAAGRIGFDLCRSLLLPIAVDPVPASERRTRTAAPGYAERLESQPLRVLSWNIHRGYAGRMLRQSLAGLLADWQPDLVLLQEVPIFPQAAFWDLDGVRQPLAQYHLEYVAMHHVSRQTAYYCFAQTGLVTLSRTLPEEVRAIPLPVVSRPKLGRDHRVQRVALVCRYTDVGLELDVCNVHLENTTGRRGRELQLRYLLSRLFPAGAGAIQILAGDFNTLFAGLERVSGVAIGESFEPVPLAGVPRLLPAVDHFFIRTDQQQAATGRVLRVPGSDHLPILLEIDDRCDGAMARGRT